MDELIKTEISEIREKKLNDPDINLLIMFTRTANIIDSAVGLELKNLKVTRPQVAVLSMLSRLNRPLSIDEMAKWTEKEFNSMSALINRMEKRDLVKKVRKQEDLKTYIILTEKGSHLYHIKIAERSIHMIFGQLSDQEKNLLISILTKLRNVTSDLLGLNYKPPFMP